MTEDSTYAVLDDGALNALLERPLTELSAGELMAIKDAYAARGIRIYNSANIETVLLAFFAAKVGVPFVQTLSQRAANSVADWSKEVTNAVHKHLTRKGLHQDTPLISLPDKMTDEAWLVLFEMVNANELHGKVHWDETAKTWRAEE